MQAQVAAGLTYGAEEELFHSLFKAAWSCQPLPLSDAAIKTLGAHLQLVFTGQVRRASVG